MADAKLEEWTRQVDEVLNEIHGDRAASLDTARGRLLAIGQHVAAEVEVLVGAIDADRRRRSREPGRLRP